MWCCGAFVALLLVTSVVQADDGSTVSYGGRRVSDVIEEFRTAGFEIAYSTNLVGDDLFVAFEPVAGAPQDVLRQILEPHGLELRSEAGIYVIVRSNRDDQPVAPRSTGPTADTMPIDNVVVAASRYEISREVSTSNFVLDQRSIQDMPDIGEDPMRVTQRLPGTAASGASARTHFRGGEENEVGIMLNGQWLFDPFHIRDYQNVFSAIDARAIAGVEVYTGGFPVRYGDRMSGLVLMDSIEAEAGSHNELGLSVFNTSALTAGSRGPHSWLFSARRGNLDIVIDPKFGQPSYYDVFGEYAVELTPDVRLSINTLYAEDQVELILETDPAEREQIVSNTKNAQIWMRLDSRWSPELESSTVLSFTDFSNRREGSANDPEKMIAEVRDVRDVRQVSLRQEWAWSPSERHRTQWGIHATWGKADYAYTGMSQYFGLPALFGRPDVDRSVIANPDGGSYALYVSDKWRIGESALLEWGLRWDDQTYTNTGSDSQLSPRLSYMFRPWAHGELRFSAGRYHQSQPIQSLQVEDGIANFWPAQRADQLIVGLRQAFSRDTVLRVEVFHKELADVQPRFENLYDPLGIMPELQADRVRLEPSRARAQGLELSLDRARGAWNWWGSYTLSKVTDRIDGRYVPRSWDQRHALQGGFGWHDERWSVAVAASVHSGWPTTDLALDADDNAVPGERNARRLPTFAVVDLRLSRKYEVRRGTLTAFVEISNSFNRRNVCCIDWDVDEDEDENLSLEHSRDYWMPLLPAIGVLWEF
jgi:outer membrane receptor protein involved in Fe transport